MRALGEPGRQPVADESGKRDDPPVQVKVPVADVAEPKAGELATAQGVEGDQRGKRRRCGLAAVDGLRHGVQVHRQRLTAIAAGRASRAAGPAKMTRRPLSNRTAAGR